MSAKRTIGRREFLQAAAVLPALASNVAVAAALGKTADEIPTRRFGKTGLELPILGFGGAGLP